MSRLLTAYERLQVVARQPYPRDASQDVEELELLLKIELLGHGRDSRAARSAIDHLGSCDSSQRTRHALYELRQGIRSDLGLVVDVSEGRTVPRKSLPMAGGAAPASAE